MNICRVDLGVFLRSGVRAFAASGNSPAVWCVALVALCAGVALGQRAPAGVASEPEPNEAIDAPLTVDSELSFSGASVFGTVDTSFWGVVGGAGFALEDDDDSTSGNLGLTYHYFLIKDFEVIGEVGGWYFAQDGDDAGGLNPGFTFRWHFINRGAWTLYADAGIGLLFSTDDVPTGGSSFNFMPRAGGGVSFRLDDRGTRGYVGARWHHVSNARINGDAGNPDRDGVMVYGGVMFPF